MKFWVVWVMMTSWTSGPDMAIDPYTGTYLTTTFAIAVRHNSEVLESREFNSKKEALDFINKAPADVKRRMVLLDSDSHVELLSI